MRTAEHPLCALAALLLQQPGLHQSAVQVGFFHLFMGGAASAHIEAVDWESKGTWGLSVVFISAAWENPPLAAHQPKPLRLNLYRKWQMAFSRVIKVDRGLLRARARSTTNCVAQRAS